MYQTMPPKISFLFSTLVVASGIAFHSSPAYARAGACEGVFESVFQKLPPPASIAAAQENDVRSAVGRAALALKTRDVLPAGRYSVTVSDPVAGNRADVLMVSYNSRGVDFSLGSKRLLQTENVPLAVSSTGEISGSRSHFRIESTGNVNVLTFVTSSFSGEPYGPGVKRTDKTLQLELTLRRPLVLVFKQSIRTMSETNDSDLEQNIEVIERFKDLP
jgi:hypothetical protein